MKREVNLQVINSKKNNLNVFLNDLKDILTYAFITLVIFFVLGLLFFVVFNLW